MMARLCLMGIGPDGP